MNRQLEALLEQTEHAMNSHSIPAATGEWRDGRTVHVGVDLGTAYTGLRYIGHLGPELYGLLAPKQCPHNRSQSGHSEFR